MKILLMGLYKPPSFNENDFWFHLNNAYKFFCTTYENVMLIGNFNMIPGNKKSSNFCEMNKFEHLILKPTCFKGLLLCTIDLLSTNHKQSFVKLEVYETGILDHHKMIISVLRKNFAKGKPKTVYYRCYKNFDQDSFNETLNSRISLPNLYLKIFLRYFNPR